MAEELKPGVVHHMRYRERMNKDNEDPAVAAANAKARDAAMDMSKYLEDDEQAWTHFILRKHPTEGDSIVGDDNGKPLRFLSRRLAKEAIEGNKLPDCTYLILAVVSEE